jgi:hypothetical protein
VTQALNLVRLGGAGRDYRLGQCSGMTPERIYAQGRRAQYGGRSRRNRSAVA